MNFGLKFSQLNGLIGDALDSIGYFFTNTFQLIGYKLILLLYKILIIPLFYILDFVQLLFRKFAGLNTVYVNGQGESGDIVLTLINNQTVQDVFWALMILAFVLLIIITIVALIRKETQAVDDKNRKTAKMVFKDVFRAMLNFFMVPVVAVLGIYMGNALLKSLDAATGGGDSTQISALIFKSCAYESNRARKNTSFATILAANKDTVGLGIISGNVDEIAEAIDAAFANGTTIKDGKQLAFSVTENGKEYFNKNKWTENPNALYLNAISNDKTYTSFSYYDADMVFYYYDLTSFNFLLAIIALIFAAYILLVTCLGLIKRIFKLVILLCISPPIVAISPLDNGSALNNWKKAFIGSTLSAYATVVTLNLTFMLIGPIQTINFFDPNGTSGIVGMGVGLANSFVQLLMICGALLFFKDFTKELSGLIGAEDAFGVGDSMAKTAVSKAAMAGGMAVGLAGAAKNKIQAKQAAKAAGGKKNLENNLKDAKGKTKEEQDKLEAMKASGASEQEIRAQMQKVDAANKVEKGLQAQSDTIKGYENKAKARFSQAGHAAMHLSTGGLDDAAKKAYGSTVNEKAVAEADKNIKSGKKQIKSLAKVRRHEKVKQFAAHPLQFTGNALASPWVNAGKSIANVSTKAFNTVATSFKTYANDVKTGYNQGKLDRQLNKAGYTDEQRQEWDKEASAREAHMNETASKTYQENKKAELMAKYGITEANKREKIGQMKAKSHQKKNKK